jgi:hypothetical protein
MHEDLVQRAADEARRAERKRRHRMDDFRYALKKVQRIDIEMTYEEVRRYTSITIRSNTKRLGRAIHEGHSRVQGSRARRSQVCLREVCPTPTGQYTNTIGVSPN